jgi:protein quaking
VNLFQLGGKESVCLPEPVGTPLQMTEKLYVPVKDHPEFNFVGRILGPRGMTAKQLEQETGCKIMVRGKGSMRDKAKVNNKKKNTRLIHYDNFKVNFSLKNRKNK